MTAMRAVILSIGDELVLGQAVDTNSAWLSEQLTDLGVYVIQHIGVGDDKTSIRAVLEQAGQAADLLLVTGGLGPTDDDLTRHVLADLLGTELQLHQSSLDHIDTIFSRMGRVPSERNRIQAMIPRGATAIHNPAGTAAGLAAEYENCRMVFMPGVPREMKAMFEQEILPQLTHLLDQQRARQVIRVRRLQVFGLSESAMAEQLGDLMERGRNPLLNCNVSAGIITLKLMAQAESELLAQQLNDDLEQQVRRRLGQRIYGIDGQSLAKIVGELLLRNKATLATAESCTGGMLGAELTNVPGSSNYYLGGWVCYANEFKSQQLDVAAESLNRHGAVSEVIAGELADNARRRSGAHYALTITGIAGPGDGGPNKPVGLVYIGLAGPDVKKVLKLQSAGDREFVRRRSVYAALDLLRVELQRL